jgi:UDP-N-acetylmuramyl pentapeptide phosphotransferase/UDP-N-acetylglucosamine-1-phosphate transferase
MALGERAGLDLLTFGAALMVIACLLSWAGVAAIRRFAKQRRLLDIPNERSSHTQPVPRGGGLAIVVVTLVLTLIVAARLDIARWLPLGVMLTAWAAVAIVSLIDDIRSLPNSVRFTIHAASAIAVIAAVGHFSRVELPLAGQVRLYAAGAVIAFFWLTGLTNAYNFMDGIDGIAGSQAIIAGLVWAAAGWITGAPLLAATGLIIAGASLGFLRYNWSPARIFMGDVGSAFLGLSLASLAVAGAEIDPRLAWVGVLAVWPFVFDASFTFVRRALRRENVFAAHRSHLYQRLVILGYGHAPVSLLYAGLAALGGVLGIAWLANIQAAPLLITILIPAAALGLWYYVRVQERARHPFERKPV